MRLLRAWAIDWCGSEFFSRRADECLDQDDLGLLIFQEALSTCNPIGTNDPVRARRLTTLPFRYGYPNLPDREAAHLRRCELDHVPASWSTAECWILELCLESPTGYKISALCSNCRTSR